MTDGIEQPTGSPRASRPLRIGVTCFPTFGGSGIVATEVAIGMAKRGHRVHVIAKALPVRIRRPCGAITFHEVDEGDHPALREMGAYPLALASKMAEVATFEGLDVLHVHYAVPHATAALLARQMLGPTAPALVTTLHGTDVTLVGADPGYLPITRLSILGSDALTAPSAFLRDEAKHALQLPDTTQIEVIGNFVDPEVFAPQLDPSRAALRDLWPQLGPDELVVGHTSNFRPVKDLPTLLAAFAQLARLRPARLVLVGDGPERAPLERQVRQAGLADRVAFLGKQHDLASVLSACDVFALPSRTEGFGLAALEALACGVPVVASRVGGLPEVVRDGETGRLVPVGDAGALASGILDVWQDRTRQAAMRAAARADALARFGPEAALDRYEALYRRVVAERS